MVRPGPVGRYLFLRFPSDNLALGTESTIADYLNVLALTNGGTLVLEVKGYEDEQDRAMLGTEWPSTNENTE